MIVDPKYLYFSYWFKYVCDGNIGKLNQIIVLQLKLKFELLYELLINVIWIIIGFYHI